jgi:hypothetical protein
MVMSFPTAGKLLNNLRPGTKTMNQELLPIVLDGEKYLQFFSFGFGIWMDLDWRKLGWDVDNPGKNYFSPEALESTTCAGLQQSDRYVWTYSETPRWSSNDGSPVKLPPAYADALRRAKQEHPH